MLFLAIEMCTSWRVSGVVVQRGAGGVPVRVEAVQRGNRQLPSGRALAADARGRLRHMRVRRQERLRDARQGDHVAGARQLRLGRQGARLPRRRRQKLSRPLPQSPTEQDQLRRLTSTNANDQHLMFSQPIHSAYFTNFPFN